MRISDWSSDVCSSDLATLLAMLRSEPELMARVVAAVRVGDRRWNLRFDNGIDVRLPELGADAAWRRLAALERKHALLDRDILTVDMRIPDRLVVRRNTDAAAEDHPTRSEGPTSELPS